MNTTEPTPRYYLEYPSADYRYRRSASGDWTRSENPMSKWAQFDKHDWDNVDYADLPVRIREQYEADKNALRLALNTQNGINAALGLASEEQI